MEYGISGKWALVCGASKGLGYACALALVKEGVNVVVVARGAEQLTQGVNQLRVAGGTTVIGVAADVATQAGRHLVFNAPGGPGTAFDIVVTNAGGPPPGDFRDWDREIWLRAIDTNMLTPIELIKATVDGMAARGFGRIVNITSGAVKAPIPVLGLSNGARSGLTGVVAGLARGTIAQRNVAINNLLPGAFDTERLRSTLSSTSHAGGAGADSPILDARGQPIPANRYGRPEEFGAICAFLCSQHAGYIVGQNILADGGAFGGW
jgi:3-oxoacyl-[acyl-carrier protein] reductase